MLLCVYNHFLFIFSLFIFYMRGNSLRAKQNTIIKGPLLLLIRNKGKVLKGKTDSEGEVY